MQYNDETGGCKVGKIERMSSAESSEDTVKIYTSATDMDLIFLCIPGFWTATSEECNYPDGYVPAASGAAKTYKKLTPEMDFTEAQDACGQDDATLVMPKTVQDLNDIKKYGCKL